MITILSSRPQKTVINALFTEYNVESPRAELDPHGAFDELIRGEQIGKYNKIKEALTGAFVLIVEGLSSGSYERRYRIGSLFRGDLE